MQLALTSTESTALTVVHRTQSIVQAAATHYPTIKHIAGVTGLTIAGAAIEVINWAAPRTIAAGIETRRFYDAHLSHHVEAAFYAIAFIALIIIACIASTVVCLYQVTAPIIRQQVAIQLADLRNFHRAVSKPEGEMTEA